MPPRRELDFAAIFTLIVICASWGAQQVAVKLALPSFPPFMQMGLRSVGAAMLVAAYCTVCRRAPLWQRDGTFWPGVFTGLLFAGEFLLIYVGLQWTDASRTSLLIYTAPFFVALAAHWLLPDERLGPAQWTGLLLSFAGIVVVMGVPHAAPSAMALVGDLMVLAAGVFWAATTVMIKTTRLRRAAPEKVLLYQLVVSAVIALGCSTIAGETFRVPSVAAALALGYQTVWIAAITFVLWFRMLAVYPASLLQAATSMTPLFGVVFASAYLDEHLSGMFVLAALLTVAGLVLVNRPRRH